MRELLDPARGSSLMLPDDDRLVGELAAPKWSIYNGSVIAVESKDDIRRRLGRSTDRADAVISSFFTSGAVPGAVPNLPVPTDPVMELLRHDPAPPGKPGTPTSPTSPAPSGTDRDPYTADVQLLRPHQPRLTNERKTHTSGSAGTVREVGDVGEQLHLQSGRRSECTRRHVQHVRRTSRPCSYYGGEVRPVYSGSGPTNADCGTRRPSATR